MVGEVYIITDKGRLAYPRIRASLTFQSTTEELDRENSAIILEALQDFGSARYDQLVLSLAGGEQAGRRVDTSDVRRVLRQLYEAGLIDRIEG